MNNDIELDLNLELDLLLDILDKTTRAYMEAFKLRPESIEISSEMIKKYQAFEAITAYYMNDCDECVSYVSFAFDWDKYGLVYNTDEPDILINRKSLLTQTPKKILEDACNIIKERVEKIRETRRVKYIKMVYTYTNKVWQDKELLEKIRKEANLSPQTSTIKFSPEIKGIDTQISSSLTEKTLSIDFVT